MLYIAIFFLICALGAVVFLALKLQSKDAELKNKDLSEQLIIKEREALLQEQNALEQELARAQSRKALAAEKITEADSALREAQRRCGLREPLSAEDFIDWLRKVEIAAKAQGEYRLCREEQEPFFAKAEELKRILLECRAVLPFYNGDSEDFYALVSAAEEKIEAIAELNAEIGRSLQKQQEILAGKQGISEDIEIIAKREQQAEQAWRGLLQNYFNGQINSALSADNLKVLSELIPYKIAADRSGREITALRAELEDALQKQMPELPQNKNAAESALTVEQTRISEAEERIRQAVAAKTEAETHLQGLIGGDRAARLEQQKQVLILEMQDTAEQYLRLKFGCKLAEAALSSYHKLHRSGMMTATERAFSELTQGAYQSLQTRAEGDKDVLLAISANGAGKRAEDMSKGARFQLYMALRAAAYEEDLLKRNINMPFFCDDIFETFDEERTKAACRLMQRIGQKGQAIYLTHHRHVAEIAREVCGENVTIHSIN